MTDPETLIALAIGVLNFAALLFVGYQTKLTRRSVHLTEQSIVENQRLQELSNLPSANLVLEVQAYINIWCSHFQRIIDDQESLRERIMSGDPDVGRDYGISGPHGLVNKGLYDIVPAWLQVILITAAQYYNDCMPRASRLSGELGTDVALKTLDSTTADAKSGINRLKELLSYIDERIPEWYLSSPARLSDADFFDR